MRHLLRIGCALLLITVSSAALADARSDMLKVVKEQREQARSAIEFAKAIGTGENKDMGVSAGLRWLGDMESLLGNDAKAVKALQEAQRLTPNERRVYLLSYQLAMRKGQLAEAATALEQQNLQLQRELTELQAADAPSADDIAQWLRARNSWAASHVFVALARGDGTSAAQWADVQCDYGRLKALAAAVDESRLGAAVRRIGENDASLRLGTPLAQSVTRLSCAAADSYSPVLALAARARAGLPLAGDDIQARYAPTAEQKDAWTDNADILHARLIDLFMLGTPLAETEVGELTADMNTLDRLNAQCEAWYFQGIYYRYVRHDEKQAKAWFKKAANSWSLPSYELILARLELGLTPLPARR